MKGKLLFVAGAAVGYVLGARAGRKRYEQIKGAAAKIWESEGIQKQVESAQDFAAARIGEVPGLLVTGVKKVVSAASRKDEDEDSGSACAAAVAAKKADAANPDRTGD